MVTSKVFQQHAMSAHKMTIDHKKNSSLSQFPPDLDERLRKIHPPNMWKFLWLVLPLVLVWLFVGSIPWWVEHGNFWTLVPGLSESTAAAYGDSFGWVNSLFSGVALVGVVVAIYLQMQELSEQRKELVITQWQLSRSADAQTKMEEAAARQALVGENVAILESISGIRDHAVFVHENANTEAERKAAKRNIDFCNEIQLGLLSNLVAMMPMSNLKDVMGKRVRNYAIYSELLQTIAEWREAFKGILEYPSKGAQRTLKPNLIESSAKTFVNTVQKGIHIFRGKCVKLGVSVEEFDSAFDVVKLDSSDALKSNDPKHFEDVETAINNLELKIISDSSIVMSEEFGKDAT